MHQCKHQYERDIRTSIITQNLQTPTYSFEYIYVNTLHQASNANTKYHECML